MCQRIGDMVSTEATGNRLFVDAHLMPAKGSAETVGRTLNPGPIYSDNSPVVTSDKRYKIQIGDIPESWLRAVDKIPFKRYKMLKSMKKKGSKARWHVGAIAQEVKSAFEQQGVDTFEIGLLCYEKWDEQGQEKEKISIRYDELFSLKLEAMARELDGIKG